MLNRSFAPFPALTTERLHLRQLGITDEHEIFTLRSDSEINKYLDRPISKTIDDARNFIDKISENINKNDSLYWAITLRDKNVLIGTICLFDFSDELHKCEIGYEILTAYQGQGIMSEAIKKIIEFAVHTLGLKTIDAVTHKDNHHSTKLLQKFKFEKTEITDTTNPNLMVFRLSN